MKHRDVSSVLNRLIAMHGRSLPVYLTDAAPWVGQSNGHALDTLEAIASDQRLTVDRIADYVQRLGGTVEQGSFPTRYADWNDLSLSFLAARVAENLASDVTEMESLLPEVAADATATALTEEALGAAKGHLDTLAEWRASQA